MQLIIGGQKYAFRCFDFARKMHHESGIQSNCTETFCSSLLSLDVFRTLWLCVSHKEQVVCERYDKLRGERGEGGVPAASLDR